MVSISILFCLFLFYLFLHLFGSVCSHMKKKDSFMLDVLNRKVFLHAASALQVSAQYPALRHQLMHPLEPLSSESTPACSGGVRCMQQCPVTAAHPAHCGSPTCRKSCTSIPFTPQQGGWAGCSKSQHASKYAENG